MRILLIDDDPLNNKISRFVIKSLNLDAEVVALLSAEEGLDFIEKKYRGDDPVPTILLLDINMPGLSGWEFLNRFEQLGYAITGQFRIYILSTSFVDKDKQTAAAHKMITGYLIKPLTAEMVQKLLDTE